MIYTDTPFGVGKSLVCAVYIVFSCVCVYIYIYIYIYIVFMCMCTFAYAQGIY